MDSSYSHTDWTVLLIGGVSGAGKTILARQLGLRLGISCVIIEGDGILPSLFARPSVRDRVVNGNVWAVFLVEPDEDVIFANMVARNRGIASRSEAELRTEARAKWLFGRWLVNEASRYYNLPVVEPRPWLTLLARVMMVVNASSP